ncbi:uncharacterized protein An02g13030 [Aspergillus niger]|uniref:Contig An02c0430, genomic contig n=2 Tax=Aspergillus niger TaxID=5061 RepID=A2QF23_ASPNC|nr:uncharacterized protein An02g13030 [Aspergillus niger]CAK37931.1 unnamed protein product [Aspergillus niger]
MATCTHIYTMYKNGMLSKQTQVFPRDGLVAWVIGATDVAKING